MALALLFVLTSCRDDVIDVTTTQDRPDPTIIQGYKQDVQPITSSVIGHVTDENGQNLENATVTMGSLTTTTNLYGHFFFTEVEMNKKGSFVQIEKRGFFKGSRRFYPNVGHTSNLEVELLEKNFNTSFQSTLGGMAPAEKGGSVEFPANAIVDADNVAYDGEVRVAAKWLDPAKQTIINQMPGDLFAVNERNNEVALSTFGMLAVELETPDGQQLNVAENSEATLIFPVPAEMVNEAPAEIPLWYFNERYGIWAQDGKATLQGDEYVGGVNHFTFWNCDLPFNPIVLDMTLVDANGIPLPNHTVSITYNGTISASSATDNMGYIEGYVPGDEVLLMKVYSRCNDIIYQEDIGPFATNTSLGDIVITNAGGGVITTVTGNLLNCNMDPVTDGLVIADYGGASEYLYTDGTPFTFNFTTCTASTPVNLTFVDFDNPGHTAEEIATSGATTNLGDIDVCNSSGPENTITVTIDGVQYVYSDAKALVGHVDSFGTDIRSDLGPDLNVSFWAETIVAGTHNGWFGQLVNTDLGWSLGANGPSTFVFTELGPNPGDKIIGSFDGMLFNPNGTSSTVNITFDIIRE